MVHRTAITNAKLFFDAYVRPLGEVTVVEIGSQNVNGSIRDQFVGVKYIGLDFAKAKGVDIVLEDPYAFPLEDESIDVVVSSSCFEHSEFFWLTFLEAIRILKPGGLFYLNAPSNGPVHGYPVDCWRFYPDAGSALARWAVRQGYDVIELESYTSDQAGGYLNDYVAVFLKDSTKLDAHPNRILPRIKDYSNGRLHGAREITHQQQLTEDQRALRALQNYLKDRLRPI
ncbi:class I SAM-dependent methyltransferase [Phenylobacterium sp.]|uniref:class I SAM-dependent methyltransferase n=1 Tax=Phenylobacterium sp. TaxID=1871053 RepID=UPI002810B6F5|nr:class I SAM-dependent methyltransferase [Phenylobacterium sp.]